MMLEDSKIDLNEKSLTISLSIYGAGRIVFFELLGFIFAICIVHQFASSDLAESNPQIKLVYLLPTFIALDLFKRIRKLLFGDKYHFDKQLNELTYNGLRKSRLDQIEMVEINYKFGNDSDYKYLELKLKDSNKIRIRDFGSKKSLIKDGREIARFLNIKMIDNFPYGKEILWGGTNLSSSSISHLNEHIKYTDNKR